ncbi:MAG: serine--tRNA ligase [bacterium]|nr:serine--tRNA ligase [bacterium]
MIDIKLVRQDPEAVKKALGRRGEAGPIDDLLAVDAERRRCLAELQALQEERNRLSREVASRMKEGRGKPSHGTPGSEIKDRIKAVEAKVVEHDRIMASMALNIPNIPHISVPDGDSHNNNILVSECGKKPEYDFNPLPHWEIGECLGILDFETATKLSGSNFPLFKGLGAKLERALYTYMLDLHTGEHGYTEVIPPYLARRACMLGTGQLPRMETDMYRVEQDDLFLVPTAEVPLVNMHREQILEEASLPLRYVSLTPCFRREAGSYGRDTRGLLRVHQFDKVELVAITRPEESYDVLEKMLAHAGEAVRRLGLAYRVSLLCAGEISFASAKTYDIEVWAPGVGQWLEVASVSNCEDFQARRAEIRCRRSGGKGTFHPHTLNGSGVALARTFLALLETHQRGNGTVGVPEALRPYMGGVEVIG